jgi:hypothetical protein
MRDILHSIYLIYRLLRREFAILTRFAGFRLKLALWMRAMYIIYILLYIPLVVLIYSAYLLLLHGGYNLSPYVHSLSLTFPFLTGMSIVMGGRIFSKGYLFISLLTVAFCYGLVIYLSYEFLAILLMQWHD